MNKIGLSLLFLLGGLAHELRNPLRCQCIATRQAVVWRLRKPS